MNNSVISWKPIFEEMRRLLGRGLTQGEVARIDRVIDRAAERSIDQAIDRSQVSAPSVGSKVMARRLGSLSERFESGGRGPGTVSNGRNDPGGVSYGIYQLASRTGTAARFMQAEGLPWKAGFGDAAPGAKAFSRAWRAVARREPDRFARAQHAFIERTHYWPAVEAALAATQLDLNARHQAVRDAVWSVSVQHGGAARILKSAVAQADKNSSRAEPGYDQALIDAIYSHRTAYVLRVADRTGGAARRTLRSVTQTRYPAERFAALAMLEEDQPLA